MEAYKLIFLVFVPFLLTGCTKSESQGFLFVRAVSEVDKKRFEFRLYQDLTTLQNHGLFSNRLEFNEGELRLAVRDKDSDSLIDEITHKYVSKPGSIDFTFNYREPKSDTEEEMRIFYDYNQKIFVWTHQGATEIATVELHDLDEY